MEKFWEWLPIVAGLPILAVGFYCLAQTFRDFRKRNLKWATVGGICATLALAYAIPTLAPATIPVQTHAVMYEIPFEGQPVTSRMFAVVRVAERAVATKYPDFDTVQNPPVVLDNGQTWHVGYKLPDGTIGGTPEIEVDKATLSVVSIDHSQ